jgi:hypothetical protein
MYLAAYSGPGTAKPQIKVTAWISGKALGQVTPIYCKAACRNTTLRKLMDDVELQALKKQQSIVNRHSASCEHQAWVMSFEQFQWLQRLSWKGSFRNLECFLCPS